MNKQYKVQRYTLGDQRCRAFSSHRSVRSSARHCLEYDFPACQCSCTRCCRVLVHAIVRTCTVFSAEENAILCTPLACTRSPSRHALSSRTLSRASHCRRASVQSLARQYRRICVLLHANIVAYAFSCPPISSHTRSFARQYRRIILCVLLHTKIVAYAFFCTPISSRTRSLASQYRRIRVLLPANIVAYAFFCTPISSHTRSFARQYRRICVLLHAKIVAYAFSCTPKSSHMRSFARQYRRVRVLLHANIVAYAFSCKPIWSHTRSLARQCCACVIVHAIFALSC